MTIATPVQLKPFPVRYTCDGADVPPSISWTEIPAHTVELDLFIFMQAKSLRKHVANWAVAGLKPSVKGIKNGQLPSGAIVGTNSFGKAGYSVCPPKGVKGTFYIHLFALPQKVPLAPGFEPSAVEKRFLSMPLSEGLLSFTYTRA